jgi:hypothetical protein
MLKSVRVEGNGTCDVVYITFNNLSKNHMGIVRGIARELDFEITIEHGRCQVRFPEPEPYTVRHGSPGACVGRDCCRRNRRT